MNSSHKPKLGQCGFLGHFASLSFQLSVRTHGPLVKGNGVQADRLNTL